MRWLEHLLDWSFSSRSIPIRANIVGPPSVATRTRASVAVRIFGTNSCLLRFWRGPGAEDGGFQPRLGAIAGRGHLGRLPDDRWRQCGYGSAAIQISLSPLACQQTLNQRAVLHLEIDPADVILPLCAIRPSFAPRGTRGSRDSSGYRRRFLRMRLCQWLSAQLGHHYGCPFPVLSSGLSTPLPGRAARASFRAAPPYPWKCVDTHYTHRNISNRAALYGRRNAVKVINHICKT